MAPSQQMQLTDTRKTTDVCTVTLEPPARTIAGTAPSSGDDTARRSKTSDSLLRSTKASAPVTTARRNPRFRVMLLLLLLVMLASVAIWTPTGLLAVTASTMELFMSTDVAQSRTAPGPGSLVGQLDVTSSPSGIELFVDGELHGNTPLLLVLHSGTHELTFVSPIGNVRRKVRVRPGHRTLFSEAIFPGSLMISSETEREVRVDGKASVTSDDGELLLAPGSYQIELVNPDNGARTTHTVEILPGQVTTLHITDL